MWFNLDQAGKVFEVICRILPFSHAVDLARYALNGDFSNMIKPFIVVLVYIIIMFLIATIVFKRKMISDNK